MSTISNESEIKEALKRTWNAIGSDLLDSCGGEMSQEEVIECVLDAGYLELYGGTNTQEFRKLGFDKQESIARKVFTYSSYVY